MLTALDFWHLIERIIPVYVIVILAFSLSKLGVIKPEHGLGISRWVSFLGVPSYVFYLLAFNDPYESSLRLVAADILSKGLILFFSCLWWKFSSSGSIEGVIGFFMLATLPNTVLIGDALLQPLYGEDVHTQVVTIIFMQTLLWYNVCICLYEARVVLLEEKQAVTAQRGKGEDHIIHMHELQSGFLNVTTGAALSHKKSSDGGEEFSTEVVLWDLNAAGTREENDGRTIRDYNYDSRKKAFRGLPGAGNGRSRKEAILERTISAPAGFFFSRSRSLSLKRTPKSKVCDFHLAGDEISSSFVKDGTTAVEKIPADSADDAAVLAFIGGDVEQKSQRKNFDQDENSEISCEMSGNLKEISDLVYSESETSKIDVGVRSGGFPRWGILGLKTVNRMKRAPMTYASIAGFIYSLIAQKYNWDMPYPIRTSLELISQSALGMAIFLMGMAWAGSGRLISCGWKGLVYGIIVRFLIGPILMIISAEAFRMHERSFQFAVLQAVLPQGVISFVLAKEYGVDIPLFNTAVVFQLGIFVPIALCYYYILDLV